MRIRGTSCRIGGLVASLFLLCGCSDTERSWAYKYRLVGEAATVTPRLSTQYRTKEECETQMTEFSRWYVALDRCVLQPPISLGLIEWETSIEVKAAGSSSNEPQEEKMGLITQSYWDCRKVRDGLLAGLRKQPVPAGASISAASCKPIIMTSRNEYTPLQISDFEGILVRGRVPKK